MLFLSYFSHVTNWWYISTCLVFGLCVAAWLFLTNGFVTTLSLYFLRYISIYLCMPSYGILFAFLTLAAWYAVSVCVTVVCPSIRLSRRSIASTLHQHAAGFLQLGRGRQISIDICRRCQSPGCGQRHAVIRGTRIDADLLLNHFCHCKVNYSSFHSLQLLTKIA